jgi:hypothetical protein
MINLSENEDTKNLISRDRITNLLSQFEESLTIENLKNNKPLVRLMDDNLNVHLDDYLTNPTIKEKYNFDRDELIKVIKLSYKFSYDEANDMIKLNYKPKRRIIVFRDVPKNQEEEIRQLFKISSEYEYDKSIQKVEVSDCGLVYVYFESEEKALEVFKWLERIKEEKKEDVLQVKIFFLIFFIVTFTF